MAQRVLPCIRRRHARALIDGTASKEVVVHRYAGRITRFSDEQAIEIGRAFDEGVSACMHRTANCVFLCPERMFSVRIHLAVG